MRIVRGLVPPFLTPGQGGVVLHRTLLTLVVLSALLPVVSQGLGAAPAAAKGLPLPRRANVNWSQFHDTANRRGENATENVLGRRNVSKMVLDWSHAVGSGIESSPAIANGMVYVGSVDGNVDALSASTGARRVVVGLSAERVEKEAAIHDDMIRVAHRAGASIRQLAEVSGLGRKSVTAIISSGHS